MDGLKKSNFEFVKGNITSVECDYVFQGPNEMQFFYITWIADLS